jgi:hypothetical protein
MERRGDGRVRRPDGGATRSGFDSSRQPLLLALTFRCFCTLNAVELSGLTGAQSAGGSGSRRQPNGGSQSLRPGVRGCGNQPQSLLSCPETDGHGVGRVLPHFNDIVDRGRTGFSAGQLSRNS